MRQAWTTRGRPVAMILTLTKLAGREGRGCWRSPAAHRPMDRCADRVRRMAQCLRSLQRPGREQGTASSGPSRLSHHSERDEHGVAGSSIVGRGFAVHR